MEKKRRCSNCMEEITSSTCPYCGYNEDTTQQAVYGLKRNTILHGKYLIGNVLGQGGFGITYIAFDISLELKVAIKEYFPMGYVSRDCTRSNELIWNNTQDGQELWKKGSENFLKEARRMAKTDVLPEIVRVREVFMENRTSYIVMDYVEGETLKAWLVKNGVMNFSDCIRMLLPLMNSLSKVHKRGLIHRDISPDNIMVTPEDGIRLLDLGAAKDLGIESNGTSQLVTKKGFSPIEQYMDSGDIGTWTDVYALCATIYYCITGKMVPEAVKRTMKDTLSFELPMMGRLPENTKRVLRQGLAIKPEDRIQTIDELARQLQETEGMAGGHNAKTEAVRVQTPEPEDMPETKLELPESLPERGKLEPEPDFKPEETPTKKKKGKIFAGAAIAAAVIIVFMIANDSSHKDYTASNKTGGNEKPHTEQKTSTERDMETAADEPSEIMTGDTGNVFERNFLMEDSLGISELNNKNFQGGVFGNENILRSSIVSVTFQNTMEGMPEHGKDAWDVSAGQDGSVMAWVKPADESQPEFGEYNLYIAASGRIHAGNCDSLFAKYENVRKINFGRRFDTGHVTDMNHMFYQCDNLKSLDLSGFDTSQVTDMWAMFCGCDNLETLNLNSFNTSNVKNMQYMFSGCSSLEMLNLSGFNTILVTDMNHMFSECSSLKILDLSGFDTSQVENMQYMFSGCSSLESLDLSGFYLGNVTDRGYMFSGCSISAREAGLIRQ